MLQVYKILCKYKEEHILQINIETKWKDNPIEEVWVDVFSYDEEGIR